MVGKTMEKTNAIEVIYQFFRQFPKWCGKSAVTPSVNELQQYLAKNFQLHNNGELKVKSAENYLERLKKFQKKYVNFNISKPLIEPLIQNNRATIYYKLDLTTFDGHHQEVYIMATFTIENNQIAQWFEVSSEKAAGRWDT